MLLAILKKIRSFLDLKEGEKLDTKNVSKAVARQVGSLYGIGGLLVGSVAGYLLGSVAACVSFLGIALVAFVRMLEHTCEEVMVELREVTTCAKEVAAGGAPLWVLLIIGIGVIISCWRDKLEGGCVLPAAWAPAGGGGGRLGQQDTDAVEQYRGRLRPPGGGPVRGAAEAGKGEESRRRASRLLGLQWVPGPRSTGAPESCPLS